MAAAIAIKAAKNPLASALPRLLTWRSPGFRRFCNGSLDLLAPSLSEPELEVESIVSTYPLIPGRKVLDSFKEEFEVGSRTITIETGKIARFANGSVVITMDETNVLSTVSSAKTDGSRDFLPLTVSFLQHS